MSRKDKGVVTAFVLLGLALVFLIGGINLAPLHTYAKVMWSALVLFIVGFIVLGMSTSP